MIFDKLIKYITLQIYNTNYPLIIFKLANNSYQKIQLQQPICNIQIS